jgi:NADPH:quinone reductase-like Zn-dependent oxidoreductase
VPFTPGTDTVGVVDKLGEGVTAVEPGQTVAGATFCFDGLGGYAEYICPPTSEVVLVPGQVEGDHTVVVPKVPTKLMSEGLGVDRPALDEQNSRPASTTLINGNRVSVDLKVNLLHWFLLLTCPVVYTTLYVSRLANS